MINIKNFDIYKIKKFFSLVTILIVIFLSTYKLIILPFIKIKSFNDEIKNNLIKLKNLEDENLTVNKILKNIKEKSMQNKKVLEELITNFTNMSFQHLGDFEKYIEELITKNNLTLNIIGRIEIMKIDDIENLWRINCPYEISGSEEKIKIFLSQLENNDFFINISSSPISFDKTNDPSKLVLKISTNLLQKENKMIEISNLKNNHITPNIVSLNKVMKNIQNYNIIILNNIKYIIIHLKNKEKYVLIENENIEINSKNYKIKIISKEPYLEYIK
ncbi:hypothetical protein [Fusobacterium sp. PH5-44]|uniref:hypothetical protein n=1 Tax=unclassified Fusobacterium TaxID=2648384 RepID=UPI003D23B419